MKKICLFVFSITVLLSCSKDDAGNNTVTVNVERAGTLSRLIEKDDKYQITNLTLVGNLDGTDIRFIREMAGRDSENEETEGRLSVLDLSRANIVSGGDYYFREGNRLYETYDNIIGTNTFRRCLSLSSVTLPNSATLIDDEAFLHCGYLTSVIIGDNVTTIGGDVFRGCGYLTDITIGNSVTTIESFAFNGCTMTSITIPKSVTTIGGWAFSDCTNLKEIHNNNPVPQVIEYSCFDVDWKTCKLYVPKGSYNAYRNASVWSEFENIIEE